MNKWIKNNIELCTGLPHCIVAVLCVMYLPHIIFLFAGGLMIGSVLYTLCLNAMRYLFNAPKIDPVEAYTEWDKEYRSTHPNDDYGPCSNDNTFDR